MMTAIDEFRRIHCNIVGVEAIKANSRHSFSRHTHDQFGIGIIENGAQASLSGRGVVEAVAGDVISVNAGEVHDGRPIGDKGRSWRMLYFDPDVVSASISDISDGRLTEWEFTRPAMTDARVAAGLRSLFSAATSVETAGILRYEEGLIWIFSELIRYKSQTEAKHLPSDTLRHARALIDDAPETSVTLASLAAMSGLSRFQFLRAFTKAFGLPPHAYILQRRINKARRSIAAGMPLAEAAAASGFSDQSHMNRVFKRSFGILPGDYAKAIV